MPWNESVFIYCSGNLMALMICNYMPFESEISFKNNFTGVLPYIYFVLFFWNSCLDVGMPGLVL